MTLLRNFVGSLVGLLICQPAFANDVLIKTSSDVYRYNGTSGAYMGVYMHGPAETAEGFCFDNSGRYCLVGNTLGSAVLTIAGVPGTITSPSYQMPHGITTGPDGKLYGTSNAFNASGITGVVKIDGSIISPFITSGVTTAWDVQFGPDHNLYLDQEGGSSILKFNGTTGAPLGVFASGGGLTNAHGFEFGPDGNLYVANTTVGNILRYNGATGAFMDEFIPAHSGGLFGPYDLSFGSDDLMYVVGGAHIRRYNGITGAFVDDFVAGTADSGGSMIGFVVPEPIILGVLPIAVLARRFRPSRQSSSLPS